MSGWRRFLHDSFMLSLLGTLVIATLLPVSGAAARVVGSVANLGVALLFFLHGAKLSREAVLAGAGHWRLHLAVLAITFGLFATLGLVIRSVDGGLIDRPILDGIVFLCLLPSTVQSLIALTAMARGNVAAAVCSAALSSLVGIAVTPLLAAALLGAAAGTDGTAAGRIVVQLLLPFAAGHLARPLFKDLLARRKDLVTAVDRGAILLVVYSAFSAAVVQGLWSRISGAGLATVLILCGAILSTVIAASLAAARALGFPVEDRITILFCGSVKSLAAGVPMAGILFPPALVGTLILPLMLYHQLQLFVCAVIARRYAARPERLYERWRPQSRISTMEHRLWSATSATSVRRTR